MRYVILRDDDTNALTPVECLERLYRPFLSRGLPVNLAVIPDVSLSAATPEGRVEGFLLAGTGLRPRPAGNGPATAPIGQNGELTDYLKKNPGYCVAQHGCHHDPFEFDCSRPEEVSARLRRGTRRLLEAGLGRPQAFVAPHDRFSQTSLRLAAGQFAVISTGWFELRRLPPAWWPKYLIKKISRAPHWRAGGSALLSHPGCRLSCQRDPNTMLDEIVAEIERRRLTVLVTHWWEYFRDGKPDEHFIRALHRTAEYLAGNAGTRVITFAELARSRIRLN